LHFVASLRFRQNGKKQMFCHPDFLQIFNLGRKSRILDIVIPIYIGNDVVTKPR